MASRPKRPRLAQLWWVVVCVLVSACGWGPGTVAPSIEFTSVPRASQGGRDTPLHTIAGRVVGARPGQRIVLYARSGPWWVQPFTEQPFTTIQPDSQWRNQTHPGTAYAALLVEPGYRPAPMLDALPDKGGVVIAVAAVDGTPVFWQARWFRLSALLTCLLGVIALHRYRLHQLSRQLSVRFEERLAERTRIAQELHDTLLQGVLSASMQLHVAVDDVPADSPARLRLNGILQLMGRVVEEGRNAVRGLRSPDNDSHDLEQAFSRIQGELGVQNDVGFRVIVEGQRRPLHPVIRDEVYRISREAAVNAFRHSRGSSVEVEVEYAAQRLRILVRDNGCGIDAQVLRPGREGHWGLSGMRERAERIGARLRVWSRAAAGTEVELSVPGHVAYQVQRSDRRWSWLSRWRKRTFVIPADRDGER